MRAAGSKTHIDAIAASATNIVVITVPPDGFVTSFRAPVWFDRSDIANPIRFTSYVQESRPNRSRLFVGCHRQR
jgi:hypothetical protein